MSWLPQRWRTQRNAIRNANCKTSWIIQILNAHCASILGACLFECQWISLSSFAGLFVSTRIFWGGFNKLLMKKCTGFFLENSSGQPAYLVKHKWCAILWVWSVPRPELFSLVWLSYTVIFYCRVFFLISNQTRGPAEFKHIIKRRKRN